MSGDVQAPSGTDLDPSPQFWVDRVELEGPGLLAVIGRCFFGPVRTGLLFDGVVPGREGRWRSSGMIDCCLRVAEIQIYGRLTDEIGQMLSARLVLSGQAPACLASDALLVARGDPSGG